MPVIEVFVKPGDTVKPRTLVTLESDKATMDVPAPSAGVVKELNVKVGASQRRQRHPAPGSRRYNAAGGEWKRENRRARRSAIRCAADRSRCAGGRETGGRPAAAPVDNEAFKVAHASPSVRPWRRVLG